MAKFGVKEVCDITLYDLVTGEPILYLDTLKMTTIENTAGSSSARGGKGNPKLLTWDFDREATMQIQDALMSPESIGLLTGNKVIEGEQTVYKRELIKAVAGVESKSKITLAETPLDSKVTVKIDNVKITGTPEVADKDVTFDVSDVAVGEMVEVFYEHKTDAKASKIEIKSDKFPGYFKLVGDTVVRNSVTGVDEPFQIIVHKAKMQPAFTLTFQADGDPTVFDLNMEIFRRDQDTSMIEMIKY